MGLFFRMHRNAEAPTIDRHSKAIMYCINTIAGRKGTGASTINKDKFSMNQLHLMCSKTERE
jgi:hypothetical protein